MIFKVNCCLPVEVFCNSYVKFLQLNFRQLIAREPNAPELNALSELNTRELKFNVPECIKCAVTKFLKFSHLGQLYCYFKFQIFFILNNLPVFPTPGWPRSTILHEL